jgi:hypothetical protein
MDYLYKGKDLRTQERNSQPSLQRYPGEPKYRLQAEFSFSNSLLCLSTSSAGQSVFIWRRMRSMSLSAAEFPFQARAPSATNQAILRKRLSNGAMRCFQMPENLT